MYREEFVKQTRLVIEVIIWHIGIRNTKRCLLAFDKYNVDISTIINKMNHMKDKHPESTIGDMNFDGLYQIVDRARYFNVTFAELLVPFAECRNTPKRLNR